ncbi:MAG: hypothetical protein RQ761_11875 [Bacteroidales bacterium]|nr:hypothetical protein [Bacteroidales bacterium]
MKVGLIGYGELGKQVESLLIDQGITENSIIRFDDYGFNNNNVHPFNSYLNKEFADYNFLVCLGYKHFKSKIDIIESLLFHDRKITNFIHKSAYLNPNITIGKSVIIFPMCNIDQNVHIENGVILHNTVTISHNTRIGRCSYIAPGVNISGNVKIGDDCFIGTGTSITNSIEIGDNTRIGIGSCVTNSIKPNSSCIGNPLRYVNRLTIL